ncbi:MAG: hypothetical protein MJZ37_00430 [Bacilli bacterium]|nr:hypothetical protein [Bacilli bacterium]
MNEQYLSFYERVKELLKQKNLTLVDTLKKLDINLDAYKSCKRYGNLPRADEVFLLAQELGTTVEYLVTGIERDKTKELIETIDNILQQYK